MSIATTVTCDSETLADVLERLGGVSLDRIRMNPPPGTATVADVVEIERQEKRLFELVDGILVEKVMGYQEAWVTAAIIYALQNYVLPRDLGAVTGPDGMIRFPENLVRMPDVAFVPWEQFVGEEVTDDPAPEVVPDFAVEVLSPSNTSGEMSRKLREYFSAGVRLVWFVNPRTKTVTVYTSPTRSKVLHVGATLDGGKVLPGFELPVANLFVKPKRGKRSKRNGN